MKILVVEDDRSVRETVGMVLETYDHEVELVDGGKTALESLSKRPWPDVMLLDLTLIDMTGDVLFHQIQRQFGRVPPTVVLSAVHDGADRIRSMPGVRFLAKPYTLDQLADVLAETGNKAA